VRPAGPDGSRVELAAHGDDVAAADAALELVEGSFGQDLAVVHDGDPVAERFDLFQVVRV
jgi:hypothetical protein